MRSLVTALLVSGIFSIQPSVGQEVTVGSKKFTESVILGDIVTRLATDANIDAQHRAELGGTRVLWTALLRGDIDVYPEYSGTILQEIFSGTLVTRESLREKLAEQGVGITQPLGFNNTYVLGVTQSTSAKFGLVNISDLRSHPDLRIGLSEEFIARGDGWPALSSRYNLPHNPIGIDHDIAYRGLEQGSIDVIDLYSTDAEIEYYNIVRLTDDREFFTRYDAVLLYRLDLADRRPEIIRVLQQLEGAISESSMIALNARAKIDQDPAGQIAADFLNELGLVSAQDVARESLWSRVTGNILDHLFLVLISLVAAILIALPLGVVATMNRSAGRVILGIVGALYTIPSLALLVFMIPLLGIGALPAIVALFLYSLLPIVRNTHSGIESIPSNLVEASNAMGLTRRTQLFKIQLPLASRSILAGIKTAAVINIGTATLGALIGAGGLGQPILTGIRLNDTSLILEGAVPAALLALLAQSAFDLSERWLVPKGLRLGDDR